MYLLDTNIISELARKNPNKSVIEFILSLEKIIISIITVEEIEFGIHRVKNKTQREFLMSWWSDFFQLEPEVVLLDLKIAKLSGEFRASSEVKGKIMQQADSVIAASAKLSNLILVTRNTKDFSKLGIKILNPFS
jgi:toxin FitB